MARKEERFNRVCRMIGATENLIETQELDTMYMKNYFARLITNQFSWKTEEIELDTSTIERTVYYNGYGIFFVENDVLVFAQGTVDRTDFYQRPVSVTVIMPNGASKTLDASKGECVVLYDNNLRDFLPYHLVNKYAQRICNADLAIEVNMENLKTPAIIECEESQLGSFADIFKKVRSNRKIIPVAKGTFGNSKAQVLDLNCPNNIPHFLDYRVSLINECLTCFGINCVDVRKRERLTSAEGESNNERVYLFYSSRLNERKRVVKEVKEKLGKNIEVVENGKQHNPVTGLDKNGETDLVQ